MQIDGRLDITRIFTGQAQPLIHVQPIHRSRARQSSVSWVSRLLRTTSLSFHILRENGRHRQPNLFRRPYPSDDRDIGRVQRRRHEPRIRRNVSLVRILCRLSCSNGNACVRTRNIRAPPVVIRFCLTAQFGKAHDVSHNTFLSCKAHVHVVQYRPGAHCSHIGSGSGYCVGDLNCVLQATYTDLPLILMNNLCN
ncbi:hypothetical protein N7530_006323 [Penicillium desertorum]|uniref:Uncharacterized protein n=1 Tax=Penicillium desertorum TaxID=1303715 RepID=A0A9W9WS92_9EURO|nr:hypothetical protein N7530_006323 [Penicillium desertorum]